MANLLKKHDNLPNRGFEAAVPGKAYKAVQRATGTSDIWTPYRRILTTFLLNVVPSCNVYVLETTLRRSSAKS